MGVPQKRNFLVLKHVETYGFFGVSIFKKPRICLAIVTIAIIAIYCNDNKTDMIMAIGNVNNQIIYDEDDEDEDEDEDEEEEEDDDDDDDFDDENTYRNRDRGQ